MPSFRFCRSDDVVLLVSILNACYDVHFPEDARYTVSRFKREMGELDLWTSSCMIVQEGDEPIGVVAGCKRETETLVYRIGIRTEYQRRGYAQHLLTSLSAKLAVLGPPVLRVELPSEMREVSPLFAKLGYEQVGSYTDYRLENCKPTTMDDELLVEVSFKDVREFLPEDSGYSWLRSDLTLENNRERLRGLAFLSGDEFEACVLYVPSDDGQSAEIRRFYSREDVRSHVALGQLVSTLAKSYSARISAPRMSKKELPTPVLEKIGFRARRGYKVYLAEAQA